MEIEEDIKGGDSDVENLGDDQIGKNQRVIYLQFPLYIIIDVHG